MRAEGKDRSDSHLIRLDLGAILLTFYDNRRLERRSVTEGIIVAKLSGEEDHTPYFGIDYHTKSPLSQDRRAAQLRPDCAVCIPNCCRSQRVE